MRTASLLILVLALKSSWKPSLALFDIYSNIDISSIVKGENARGGWGLGPSGAMLGGSTGSGGWGGNGGYGGWGCNSPSGCNLFGFSRTVADESTESAGESEFKNLSTIDVHVPLYIYVPSEMQIFTDKQRIARSLIEKLIPNLIQNSESTSEKRMTSNSIESVATSVPAKNPMSAIKDMQKIAQDTSKGRLPRSAESRLYAYLNYEAQDEVTNRVVK